MGPGEVGFPGALGGQLAVGRAQPLERQVRLPPGVLARGHGQHPLQHLLRQGHLVRDAGEHQRRLDADVGVGVVPGDAGQQGEVVRARQVDRPSRRTMPLGVLHGGGAEGLPHPGLADPLAQKCAGVGSGRAGWGPSRKARITRGRTSPCRGDCLAPLAAQGVQGRPADVRVGIVERQGGEVRHAGVRRGSGPGTRPRPGGPRGWGGACPPGPPPRRPRRRRRGPGWRRGGAASPARRSPPWPPAAAPGGPPGGGGPSWGRRAPGRSPAGPAPGWAATAPASPARPPGRGKKRASRSTAAGSPALTAARRSLARFRSRSRDACAGSRTGGGAGGRGEPEKGRGPGGREQSGDELGHGAPTFRSGPPSASRAERW